MNENDKPRTDQRRPFRKRRNRGESVRKEDDKAAPPIPVGYRNAGPSIADRLIGENGDRYHTPERLPRRGDGGRGRGDNRSSDPKTSDSKIGDGRWRKPQASAAQTETAAKKDRSQVSVRASGTPIPKPLCPRCGKPIEDLAAAINDKDGGEPCHFDCVTNRIGDGEILGDGDKIVYIGGGRFGVVHFDNPTDLRRFEIRKTIQWEEKDKRSEWRRNLADRFSAT